MNLSVDWTWLRKKSVYQKIYQYKLPKSKCSEKKRVQGKKKKKKNLLQM